MICHGGLKLILPPGIIPVLRVRSGVAIRRRFAWNRRNKAWDSAWIKLGLDHFCEYF